MSAVQLIFLQQWECSLGYKAQQETGNLGVIEGRARSPKKAVTVLLHSQMDFVDVVKDLGR